MVYLRDFIDFDKVASELGASKRSFQKFFCADERSDFWYYSAEQCQEVLEDMKRNFLEEMRPQLTFEGKIAHDCGLELIGEAAFTAACIWS